MTRTDARLRGSCRQLPPKASDYWPAKGRDWLPSLAIPAEAAALLDERAHATELYALPVPHRRRNIVDARATYCYGSPDHYVGLLATTMSRWTGAIDHLDEALAFHRRARCRPAPLPHPARLRRCAAATAGAGRLRRAHTLASERSALREISGYRAWSRTQRQSRRGQRAPHSLSAGRTSPSKGGQARRPPRVKSGGVRRQDASHGTRTTDLVGAIQALATCERGLFVFRGSRR